MSYTLKIDEMLEALLIAQHPLAKQFQAQLEALGDTMASALCDRFQIDSGSTSFEGVAFAGTACTFSPRYSDQPLPEAMEHYDNTEEWEASQREAPERPGQETSGTASDGEA